MTDALAYALLNQDTNDPVTFRVGTISGTAPVEVTIAATSGLSANYIDSYTPTNGDIVYIAQNSSELVIIGKLRSGG